MDLSESVYLPDECWAHVHCFLYIREFCWPRKIPKRLRQHISFKVRCYRAQPLYKPPLKKYKPCVVHECTASRGAFRDLIVSPYCVYHACTWSCPKILYFRAPF